MTVRPADRTDHRSATSRTEGEHPGSIPRPAALGWARGMRETSPGATPGTPHPETTKHQTAETLARTLEVVGERWTLLIVRDAFYGVRRFGDFASQLGIPRAVLTSRLKSLVQEGVLTRDADAAGTVEYRLTAKSIRIEPGPGFDPSVASHDPMSLAINTPRRLLEPITAPPGDRMPDSSAQLSAEKNKHSST